MGIPRRLKEIATANKVDIVAKKRSYILVNSAGKEMLIDLGQVVTMDQWEELAGKVRDFAKVTKKHNAEDGDGKAIVKN